MARLAWLIGALTAAFAGYDLLIRGALGWAGWLLIGVGIGVGTSVLGSLAHDLLAGPTTPRR